MIEYDQAFVSWAEYMNIYRALIGDLEENKKRKEYIIKKNQADIIDINERIKSIEKAHQRAEEEINESTKKEDL